MSSTDDGSTSIREYRSRSTTRSTQTGSTVWDRYQERQRRPGHQGQGQVEAHRVSARRRWVWHDGRRDLPHDDHESNL